MNIRNRETPSDTRDDLGIVPAGTSKDLYMWIPWCTDKNGFPKHHIRLELSDGGVFSIWQANMGGKDRVRISNDEAWHDPGEEVGGHALVDGDRTLIIDDLGLSLEVKEPPKQPERNSGTTYVGLYRHDISDSTFTGRSAFLPDGAVIDRIQNTVGSSEFSDVEFTIEVRFREDSKGGVAGRPAGPVELQPGESETGEFAGLRANGTWEVKPFGSNIWMVKGITSLTLWWTRIGSSGSGLTSAPVIITAVVQDPVDKTRDPAGEYVEIGNISNKTVDVGGWVIKDVQGHEITIPPHYKIKPRKHLLIFTASGTNASNQYYAGRKKAIWNQGGDTISLYDATGKLVYDFVYS